MKKKYRIYENVAEGKFVIKRKFLFSWYWVTDIFNVGNIVKFNTLEDAKKWIGRVNCDVGKGFEFRTEITM